MKRPQGASITVVDAAEALSERAIRETRNLEDVVAETLEREAGC